MKILIVDDEPLARERLRRLLTELALGDVVAEADNGAQAIALCEQHPVDVVLLDIRMPVLDGIDTAKVLGRQAPAPAIIFTTAYDEYALQAFDVHAIDYLVKPIRRERLAEALHRVARLNPTQLQGLEAADDKRRTHIRARNGNKLELIAIDSIHCLHAEHKYVTVFHQGGHILIEESLKSLEPELSEDFFRIHRNAIINMGSLERLVKDKAGQWQVSLKGVAHQIEVSRRHLPALRQRIKAMGA
ncbi:MAG: LytTR family DNA-binding domain-containing protein [Gammaproteobacteria bacterium]